MSSKPENKNESELSLLLKAVEPGVFQFIIVRHNHLSWVTEVEKVLHNAHPDRKISRVKLPLGYRQGIQYKVVEQESGFLLVDNFEKILEDDSARVNFNQRRDLLSEYPLALIVFIPDSIEILRQLQKGMKDFWSIRNLEIELWREPEQIRGIGIFTDFNSSMLNSKKEDKYLEIDRLRKRIQELEADASTVSYRADMSNQLGRLLDSIGEYQDALFWFENARRLDVRLRNRKGEARVLNNIGQIYSKLGKYDTALRWLTESLKIGEEVGDNEGLSATFSNIGQIHLDLKDYEKASSFLAQGLKIAKQNGDLMATGASLNSIGQLQLEQRNLDEALDILKESLRISTETGNRVAQSAAMNNISMVYDARGDYESAMSFLLQGLEILRELGDILGMAMVLNNLGSIFYTLGKSREAIASFSESLDIFEQTGSPNLEFPKEYLEGIKSELGPTRYQEIIDSLTADENQTK